PPEPLRATRAGPPRARPLPFPCGAGGLPAQLCRFCAGEDIAMRVLLVDPSGKPRLGLQIMMQGEGYPEARTATSGRAALDVLGLRGRSVSESDVDVIVMDSVLPDLDALEVCRQIKDAPRWHDTPVLLLTGTPEEHPYD